MLPYILRNMCSLNVIKEVSIINNTLLVDGEVAFESQEPTLNKFLKELYNEKEIKYGKYFKMDGLSKLGFITSEVLLENFDLSTYNSEEIAVVFANSVASISNDIAYQKTVEDVPSPAVFVYTLANIVIGEICIKNKITGENIFFVQESFDTAFISNYVNALFASTNTQLAMVGWIELNAEGSYESYMCLVGKDQTKKKFEKNNIYKKK